MNVPQATKTALFVVARDLADAARAVTLEHFRSDQLTTDNKDAAGGFDPVTEADRSAEAAMRAILAKERPEDGILGEEMGTLRGSSGFTWVLDPIDGTRAFVSGIPMWGILIAVDAGAGPVLGIIDQPYIGERFIGGLGQAALIMRGGETRPLRTRSCSDLGAATLFTTFPEVGTPAEADAFGAVRDRVRLTRYGADCYAYAMLALGQVDLVIEAGLQAYDIQAPIAVIEAAGGIVTDWQGGPAHRGGRVLAAGDTRVHAQALEVLSRM